MKQGLPSIAALAQRLDEQAKTKRDFIAPTSQLEMIASDNALALSGQDHFTVTDLCHEQIAERMGIPIKYYKRMRDEAPQLLDWNVNHWFSEQPKTQLVRTLGGNARAFLSDRYQRIDNDEVARTVLPILQEIEGLQVASCEITETRMYIKATTPRIAGEVKKGDVVQAGIAISNSEVGAGAVTIAPLVFRLVCTNGMILPDSKLRAAHIGARADKSDSVYEMLSDETRAADDRAILLKVRDVTRASMTSEFFQGALERMQSAAGQPITGKPVKVVEVATKRFGLLESESESVLEHLFRDGDLSKWGLVNAVTRTAEDVKSYDRATELEALGGRILDLPANDWRELAAAA